MNTRSLDANVAQAQGSAFPGLCWSVYFDDSSRLHDRRLLLPFGETRRALPVNVNPREFFPVMVVNGDLPMTVFAPPVAPES